MYYYLFSVAFVSIVLVAVLAHTEFVWFAYDERPMLEQIEEARRQATYNQYDEAELTGQYVDRVA